MMDSLHDQHSECTKMQFSGLDIKWLLNQPAKSVIRGHAWPQQCILKIGRKGLRETHKARLIRAIVFICTATPGKDTAVRLPLRDGLWCGSTAWCFAWCLVTTAGTAIVSGRVFWGFIGWAHGVMVVSLPFLGLTILFV